MTRTVVAMSTPVRVIHIRLFRRTFWEVFECPGVEPFYYEKEQAVYYAGNSRSDADSKPRTLI